MHPLTECGRKEIIQAAKRQGIMAGLIVWVVTAGTYVALVEYLHREQSAKAYQAFEDARQILSTAEYQVKRLTQRIGVLQDQFDIINADIQLHRPQSVVVGKMQQEIRQLRNYLANEGLQIEGQGFQTDILPVDSK